MSKSFRFIDLFAGIGGFRVGFEAIGGKCVFTSEQDRFSQKTYKANFPDDSHTIAGDITAIEEKDIPAHDLLLAGFPCQPFSIAGISKKNSLGKAHGFDDETQGTLFFDIVRILRYHKPRAFLLENVKNLQSHDNGNTLRVILNALDRLDYEVDYRIINAQNWVPQHRQRIFISGFHRDFSTGYRMRDVVIPKGYRPVLKDILHPENGSEPVEPPYTTGSLAKVADKYTLTPKLWGFFQKHAAKHRAAGAGFGFSLKGSGDIAGTLTAHYFKGGSEILIKQNNNIPRRLTPRECCRLMGFDRPGTGPWIIPVSDTRAYRQFGNAVVVPVIMAIADAMKPWLTDTKTHKAERKAITGKYLPELKYLKENRKKSKKKKNCFS